VKVLRRTPNRKLIVFPLMDMFFILLVFYFLVEETSSPMGKTIGLPQATGMGIVHTVIQIVGEDRFLWLDQDAIEQSRTTSWSNFVQRATIDRGRLTEKINTLRESLAHPEAQMHRVLVRCPNMLGYGVVRSITDQLMRQSETEDQAARKLNVSVLGGSVTELASSHGQDDQGEYLQLTFP